MGSIAGGVLGPIDPCRLQPRHRTPPQRCLGYRHPRHDLSLMERYEEAPADINAAVETDPSMAETFGVSLPSHRITA